MIVLKWQINAGKQGMRMWGLRCCIVEYVTPIFTASRMIGASHSTLLFLGNFFFFLKYFLLIFLKFISPVCSFRRRKKNFWAFPVLTTFKCIDIGSIMYYYYYFLNRYPKLIFFMRSKMDTLIMDAIVI